MITLSADPDRYNQTITRERFTSCLTNEHKTGNIQGERDPLSPTLLRARPTAEPDVNNAIIIITAEPDLQRTHQPVNTSKAEETSRYYPRDCLTAGVGLSSDTYHVTVKIS